MYEFYDKFVSIALPRMRDFRGVTPTSFDGRGNYALGVKSSSFSPEISYDQVEKIRGFRDSAVVDPPRKDGRRGEKSFSRRWACPSRNKENGETWLKNQ